MRTFSFRFFCAAVLGLPLLLPLAARSQGQPFEGVEEGQSFDLDFDHGRFLKPLPFDVFFYVQFDRAGATSASGKLAETAPVNCNQASFADNQSLDLGTASTGAVDGTEKLLIPVRPLQVNRSYCFKFTRRTPTSPEQGAKFQAEAIKEIELALRQDDVLRLQQDQPYNALRLQLIERVEDIIDPAVLDVPNKSFFNKDIPLSQVSDAHREKFNKIVGDLYTVQQSLTKGFRDRTGKISKERFETLAREIRDFGPKLENAQARSATLRAAIQEAPEIIALPRRTSLELERIALGLDPSGATSINFGRISTPEEVRPLREQLAATRDGLDRLQKVFLRLVTPSALAVEAGLQGPAEQAKIARIVVAAKAASEGVGDSLFSLDDVTQILQQRNRDLSELVQAIQSELVTTSIARGTTLAPYEVRAGWYISMDAGIGVASEIAHRSSAVNDIFTYVGTNVYFHPVNKKAHLRPLRDYPADERRDEILKRFAITVGVPTDPLKTPSELSGVIGNSPLILGAGYRLSDSFRTSLGALVFQEKDPQPLRSKERFSVVPFLSFSIDYNVRGLLSRLGGAFLGSNPGVTSPAPSPAIAPVPKQTTSAVPEVPKQ